MFIKCVAAVYHSVNDCDAVPHAVYVVAVNVLAVIMEAIVTAIAQVVVTVVAGVIYAIVGGIIQAILSGITGRRVRIPPPPQMPRFTSLRPTQPRTSSHTGMDVYVSVTDNKCNCVCHC